MHVAISGRCLAFPVGGVRAYAWALTRALLKLGSGHRFTVYLSDPALSGAFPPAREVVLRAPHKFLWDHVVLPRRIARDRPDVVWFPHNVIGLGVRVPSVVTVTDLLYFPLPGFEGREYAWPDTLYMRHFIPRSARRARRVTAISACTARDLMRLTGLPRERVGVLPLAPAPEFRPVPPATVRAVLDRHAVRAPYFLYTGGLSPRKNIPCLLEAFDRVRGELPHALVLTGAGIARRNRTHRHLRARALDARVRVLGHVPAEDLAALYQAAEAFVFPSWYEGFGLPPLEAFACGCPVLCSTGGSLPEVVGTAAACFDPGRPDELAAALRRVATDAEWRASLVAQGACRLGNFSYERSAGILLAALESAAGSGAAGGAPGAGLSGR